MDKELFVFVRKNIVSTNMYPYKPRLYTKKQAEDAINVRRYEDHHYTLYRLVPCSVSEEPVTVQKKVIV